MFGLSLGATVMYVGLLIAVVEMIVDRKLEAEREAKESEQASAEDSGKKGK